MSLRAVSPLPHAPGPRRTGVAFSAIHRRHHRSPLRYGLKSDPPGAEAKSSLGPGCRTPCALPVAGAGGSFAVTMTMPGYLPQTVPVQVLAPGAPDAGGARFTPNPVFAKLEPTRPAKKKARKKVAAKVKPAADPETTASAPAPAAATAWPPPR